MWSIVMKRAAISLIAVPFKNLILAIRLSYHFLDFRSMISEIRMTVFNLLFYQNFECDFFSSIIAFSSLRVYNNA